MKAVILAAGNGTRMFPITVTTPKLLLPVFNRPLLNYFVENLEGVCDEIILVVSKHHLSGKIREYVEKANYPIPIKFAVQEEPKGTGNALQSAKEFFIKGERLLVMNGDDLYSKKDVRNIVNKEYAVVGKEVSDPQKWGIFKKDENGILINVVEKPTEPIGTYANIGMYLLNADIFDYYENTKISSRGEFEITDGLNMFAKNYEVSVIGSEDYWCPIGYPWHLIEVHEQLINYQEFKIEGEIEGNVRIKGRLSLGKGSVIKSGTYIEGDVIIGENTIIGPNAYLRGTTVIGNDCKICFVSEVKNSVIFNNSCLPHRNFVGDGVICNNVNLGGGTTVTNLRHDGKNVETMVKGNLVDTGRRKFSTVIGDNVSTGGSTIIYPGRKIWPDKTTLPGEIVMKDIE